jgi:hypothetical protein
MTKKRIDDGELRKGVLLKIAAAPTVLLPTVAGATTLLAAWGLGQPAGVLSFLGVAGILTGLGALATRWITGVEKATAEVIGEAEAEGHEARQRALDELEERLRGDEDPRSERYLQRLRDMFERFEESPVHATSDISTAQLVEITSHATRLRRSCTESLERSLVLWTTAQSLNTDAAREATLAARERVFDEVESSIDHLATILDGVRTLSLADRSADKMAAIRTELEASLDVARRVEERMQNIRDSLDGDRITD